MAASTTEKILNHMQCGFSISPATAAEEYQCYCLAQVIAKIEKRDITIHRRIIPGTKSKEYSLTPFEE